MDEARRNDGRSDVMKALAFVLSAAMTPALVATVTMAFIAWRFGSGWRAAGSFGVMMLFGTVFGMTLAVVRARRKGLSDLHIHEVRDRPWFFAICAGVAAVGWGVLLATGAPAGVLVFMGGYGACLAVIALATLVTKPSVHCAAMTALAGMLFIDQVALGLAAVAALGALVWARLHRKRHTLAQCVFGIAIGAAIVVAAYLVWKGLV